jgi:uncharacterized repeat protein (TIGR01451 family)
MLLIANLLLLSACSNGSDSIVDEAFKPQSLDEDSYGPDSHEASRGSHQRRVSTYELCDNRDNDGDGVVDENCTECTRFTTRGKGFWKTNTCLMDGDATGQTLLPITIGSSTTFYTSAEVAGYINTPPLGNKRIVLGHQLLTAKLNAKTFTLNDLLYDDVDGDGSLDTVAEILALGDYYYESGTNPQRASFATVLEEMNQAGINNGLFFDTTCQDDPEICGDGIDNDGDRIVDHHCSCAEICDGADNDGDGSVDEGLDSDADGICDADDVEECDGLDNDGNGLVDEGLDSDFDGLSDCFDVEECDGFDNNGDGAVDEGFDADSDTIADCFDIEECDGLDNNGDGYVDEGFDADNDGIADCFDVEECDGVDNNGDGAVDEGFDADNDSIVDCNDTEECDGLDNDGDGSVDEGFDSDNDGTADCFDVEDCDGQDNDGDGAVDEGFDSDNDGTADCFDVEECDGVDNNGDGSVDEGFDSDGDGTADCFDVEECDGVDNNGDGSVDEGFDADNDGTADCFDVEECDGADNDGDGEVDEGFDQDNDGFTDCFETCSVQVEFCSAEDGENVLIDGSPAVATYSGNPRWTASIPGATWIWDEALETSPTQDQIVSIFRAFTIPYGATNLAGSVEMAADNSYEVWLNGNGVGSDSTETNYFAWSQDTWDLSASLENGTNQLEFEVWNWAQRGGNAYSNPGGLLYCVEVSYDYEMDQESCDGVDNDCDGEVDEGMPDGDNDGLCDELDVEECDGVDNNGDGSVDEGFDADNDGVADCFDSEECDGLDNDGDGAVDNGFADEDQDGIADCMDSEECDDNLDNDGDGEVDEGCAVDCPPVVETGCVSFAEAFSNGWISAKSSSNGVAVKISNSGSRAVCIDEQVLFTSDTSQAFFPDVALINNHVQIAAGGSVTMYYASWTTYNNYYRPYYGQYGWWCVEVNQYVSGNASFDLYGEVAPEDLLGYANYWNNVDGDSREDHVDWAGSYGVQTNYSIWSYQASRTILTIGKSAVVNGDQVTVTLTVRNFGYYSGSGAVSDVLPEGWSLVSATGSPVQSVDGNGQVNLDWNVTLSGYTVASNTVLDTETLSYTMTRDSNADTPELTLDPAIVYYHDRQDYETSESLYFVIYEYDGNGDGIVECDE